MKCRIQIRLTESNYWGSKIPSSFLWEKEKIQIQCTWTFYPLLVIHVCSLHLPRLPLSLYYPSFLFLHGTQVLGNSLFLSICLIFPASLSLPSFSFSPCVWVCVCWKNRWLFPLHCHQWGLIYDAHPAKSPIKSLFTVERQDHQKQRAKCYEATISNAHEAVVSQRNPTMWKLLLWIHAFLFPE